MIGLQRNQREYKPTGKEEILHLEDLPRIYGSPGRIRTYNPSVNSRMLCR